MHGESLGNYAYGMWTVVVFNILLFSLFVLGFLRPKKRFEWRSMGAFLGFLAALFTEMYGFPLTVFLLTGLLGKNFPVLDPFSHPSGHLALVLLGLAHSAWAMAFLHLITNGLIFFGLFTMYSGWMKIHRATDNQLVTDGIYRHIRHPQYAGLFLVTIGFIIQWPSLTALVMWPVLICAYFKLAKREERELEAKFGEEYLRYRRRVPGFFPGF